MNESTMMGGYRFWIILLFLFLTGLIYPQEDIVVHDPVLIQQKDQFYLFCTGPGISTFTSPDLKNGEKGAQVFREKPGWADTVVPGFKNHIWAPDISFHNHTYYLYYAVSAFGKNTSAIGLATNNTLDPQDPGFKWVDRGIVVQSVPNRDLWNAIDPNLVLDDNHVPWLAFGSFWSGLKMVKLTDDLTEIAKPEEWYTIAGRKRSPGLADDDPGDAALEAPFIFRKNGYYYLFVSWDYCCRAEKSTYKVVVGRSRKATGPYLDKEGKPLSQGGGTLLIEGNGNWHGAGHSSTYTFKGKDYIFFQAYDAADNGRPKLRIAELGWMAGWPLLEENALN